MTGRFIVFEGLDGSGKSTTARRVAERLDGRFMTTPSEALREVRGDVVAGLTSPIARQTFYLATVEEASEEIRAAVAAGVDVVLDRYLLSTMAYAEQRGDALRWPALEQRLLAADVTVFLDVPLDVRRARLEARGANDADRETLEPSFDRGVRERYRCWSAHPVAGRFVSLTLSGEEDAEGVVERVLAAIGGDHAASRGCVEPWITPPTKPD